MIKPFHEIIELDNCINKEMKAAYQYLPLLLRRKSISKTAELFFMHIVSTDAIKHSLFSAAESKNIYTVKILFRSLVEHFLRFQYIWFQYIRIDDGEPFSKSYYIKLGLSEKLSNINSTLARNRISNVKGKTREEMWSEAQSLDPRFATYSIQEIEKFSREISIKNIITALSKEIEKKSDESCNLLKDLISRYATLSSFVHGGLHAHHNLIGYEKSGKLDNDLCVICGVTLQITSMIKTQSLVVLFKEKHELGSILRAIQVLTEQIVSKPKS